MSELGTSVTLTVALCSRPITTPLLVHVASALPTEATVDPAVVVFAGGASWASQTAVIAVTGVRDTDNADGDVPVLVTLTPSGSSEYTGATASIVITNLNIVWPTGSSVSPGVLPMVGGTDVVVHGSGLLSGLLIDIVDVDGNEDGSERRRRRGDGGGADTDSTVTTVTTTTALGDTASFVSPVMAVEGYKTLVLRGSDGGESVWEDPDLFFTADCPQEGMYGRGTECKRCPQGVCVIAGTTRWSAWPDQDHVSHVVHALPCVHYVSDNT